MTRWPTGPKLRRSPSPTVQTPANLTRKPLVTDVSSHVVHRFTLELSFRLTVKAHVQLLAKRRNLRVAQTAPRILKAGRHMLMLRLNPHSWPNKLKLNAIPLEALPVVESKGASGQTVAPPVSANSVGPSAPSADHAIRAAERYTPIPAVLSTSLTSSGE